MPIGLTVALGVVAIILAVVVLLVTLNEESPVGIVPCLVLAACGVFLVQHGWHRQNVADHRKHDAILASLREQGYRVAFGDVSIGGIQLDRTSEVDLDLGGCSYPFIARKIGEDWHPVVPSADGNGVRVVGLAEATAIGYLCKVDGR